MPPTTHTPVVLLAFANDRVEGMRYLRNLPEEARRLREILQQAQQAGLCEVVLRQNCTLDEILDLFQDPAYRNRVALFHYGGHANGYQLLLESADGQRAAADAGGLAAFLGQQQGLKVVFLNGCSTEPQVQALLEAGVPAVIATSQAIDDAVATEFGGRFYQALAGGAALPSAFAQAEAAVQTARGGQTRHLYAEGIQAEAAGRWPWALSLRPGAETMNQWSLPDLAGDLLFGLPPLPARDLPQSPYRYLDWYRPEDAELFFGRGRAIRDLYTYLTSPDSPPLLLFYGQSGVGKSSLLAAGLLPRLDPTHTVVYLRRAQTLGLLGTLTSPPSPLRADAPGLGWRTVEEQTGKPLLVILDQVEELFTRPNPDQPDEMQTFLAALQGVFGDPTTRPQGKLILSFRKEWLAEIEKRLVEAQLPRAKVFLERLDRASIVEVVMGPTRVPRLQQHYGLEVEAGLAEVIADDLLADPDSPVATMLQILLAKLWEQATERSPSQPRFDTALYQAQRRNGLALDAFLDEQLQLLRQAHAAAVESGLEIDLLALHTTAKGTAEQRSSEALAHAYPHHPNLPALVQRNQELYLLSEVGGEGGTAGVMRLAHDTLAPLVRHRYEESDAPGQRARRILENRAVEWEDGKEGAPLDEADLALVEAGSSGMRTWSADEVRLVEASRAARAGREQERARRRRWSLIAVGLIALLAVVGLGLAFLANAQAQRAQAEASRADAARQLAALAEAQARAESTRANLEAERAQAEAMRAVEAQAAAEAESARANTEAQRAEAEARVAQSRALAAAAQLQAEANPMRAWLLAIEAGRAAETDQAFAEIERQAPHLAQPLLTLRHEDIVSGAQWNTDESRLLTWSRDNTARVWDTATGAELLTLRHEDDVNGAQWNGDESRIFTWSTDNTARVWDAESGAALLTLRHEDIVSGAQWNGDGSWLLTWSRDGTARVWDAESGAELLTLRHVHFVYGAQWNTDESRLLTWSRDGTARVWDAETGELVRSLAGDGSGVTSAQWNGDESQLLLTTEGGQVVRYYTQMEKVVEAACGHATRNLTLPEWQLYLPGEPYHQTCPTLPVHTSVVAPLLAQGEMLARQGDIEAATAAFAQALELFPNVEISAVTWNTLCWQGSLWGQAAAVIDACERAVALAPENAGIRDSRGLARALTGDIAGAIEDFTYFVDQRVEQFGADDPRARQRQAWIEALAAGRTPFDEATLQALRE